MVIYIYIAQEFQDGPSPSRWLVLRQKNIVAVCLLHNLAIHLIIINTKLKSLSYVYTCPVNIVQLPRLRGRNFPLKKLI